MRSKRYSAPDSESEAALGVRLQVGWQRAGAAQDALDASQQLTRAEGLDEIVVGAHLDAHDAVGLLTARGKHQHRNVGPGTQVTTEHQTIGVGQHQIQHDQVDGVALQRLRHLAAIARRHGIEPVANQIVHQQLANLGIVVDDEDAVLGVHGHEGDAAPDAGAGSFVSQCCMGHQRNAAMQYRRPRPSCAGRLRVQYRMFDTLAISPAFATPIQRRKTL